MAKTDTDFFNPNAMAQDFAFTTDTSDLKYKLEQALYPESTL